MNNSETGEKSEVDSGMKSTEQADPLSRNPFTAESTSIDMEQSNLSTVGAPAADAGAGTSWTPSATPAPVAPPTSSAGAVRHFHLLRDIFSLTTAPSPATLRSVYNRTNNTMTQHPLSSNDPPGWRQMGANPTRMSGNDGRSTSLREGEKLPLCGGPKREGADSEPGVPPNSDPATSQHASSLSQAQAAECRNRNQSNNDGTGSNEKIVLELARFLPILFIFFVKFSYDHWEALLYVLFIQFAQLYFNRTLLNEVARFENKRTFALILNLCLGIFVVGWRLYIATHMPDPLGLILPPSKECKLIESEENHETLEHPLTLYADESGEPVFELSTERAPLEHIEKECKSASLGSLLHHAILSDLILQIITTVIKTLITLLPMHDMKFRGRTYALIENISQFYRALTPISVWCTFFYYTYRDPHVSTAILMWLYILYKLCEIRIRCRSVNQAITTLQRNVDSKRAPTKDELDNAGTVCSICSDSFRSPVILECDHVFCEQCIYQWLLRVETCPVCKKMVSDNPHYQDGKTSASYQIY